MKKSKKKKKKRKKEDLQQLSLALLYFCVENMHFMPATIKAPEGWV